MNDNHAWRGILTTEPYRQCLVCGQDCDDLKDVVDRENCCICCYRAEVVRLTAEVERLAKERDNRQEMWKAENHRARTAEAEAKRLTAELAAEQGRLAASRAEAHHLGEWVSRRNAEVARLTAELADRDQRITEANLTGVDLSGVNLTGAILRGAIFRGADMRRTNLTDADLRGADMSGVDLSGAVLRGANLTGADLTGVDLTGVDLTGVDLSGVDLTDVDLTDATMPAGWDR